MDNVERTQRNLATLRRTIGDLDALILPGDYDLQQAALFTLAQLMRNAYQLHMKELAQTGATTSKRAW